MIKLSIHIILRSFKCLFKSLYHDLKCFNMTEIILLILLALLLISFSVIDFNVLITGTTDITKLILWNNCINNNSHNSQGQYQCVNMIMTCITSFTGILAVVLISKRKLSAFFWGFINNVLMGLFAFSYGYAGNAQIFIVFCVPIQFVGLYMWSNESDNKQNEQNEQNEQNNEINIKVKNLGWLKRLLYFILFIIIAVGFYYEIPAFSIALTGTYPYESNQYIVSHILDAISNSLIIIGNILMLQQYVDQWILWFLIDIISITMYSGVGNKPDFNILVMSCIYIMNALYGFILWINTYLKQKNNTVINLTI